MLKILHKGNQISIDLDQSGLTGDALADRLSAYIQGLKAGRVVAATPAGAVLADGDETGAKVPLGFLINDAAAYDLENIPALASGKLGITFGNCVVVTDQIDTTETFAIGDKVYCGTASEKGLITKTAPSNARAIGIALSAASSASPELTIAVEG